MKMDTLAHVKNQFSAIIENLGDEPVFITRNGKVAAVLTALTDDDVEDYLLRNSPRFWRLIEARRAQAKAGKTLPFDAAAYAVPSDLRAAMTVREKGATYRAARRRRRTGSAGKPELEP